MKKYEITKEWHETILFAQSTTILAESLEHALLKARKDDSLFLDEPAMLDSCDQTEEEYWGEEIKE